MKKLTTLLLILISFGAFSQENFKWDKIYNIDGDQYELFIRAKNYISKIKGAQYSDEKNHVVSSYIKTKAKYETSAVAKNNIIFEYRLTIMTKDNKVRVLIDDVHSIENRYLNMPATTQYIGDRYNLNKECFAQLMRNLRDKLNIAVKDAEVKMNEPLVLFDEW